MLWPLIVVAIAVGLAALIWALLLAYQVRDRRFVILAGLLALILTREFLDVAAQLRSAELPSPWQEIASIAVSALGLLAVGGVRRLFLRERAIALESRRIEDELRASRARFAGILDIAEDAIISVNLRQKIVLFNRGAEKIFGYAAPDVLGQPLNLLIPPRFVGDHGKHLEEFACGPVPSRRMGERREVYGRRQDGSEFPADISISKLELNGELSLTAIVRDGTERRRHEAEILQWNRELEQRVAARTTELTEANRQLQQAVSEVQSKSDELQSITQQLWQAAKLATVGELAASIAHELNNPLGTISLRLESVLAQTPSADPRRRPLEIVEAELERMTGLIANVLQFSRRGREQVSTVNVCDEIRKTLELTRHHLKKRNIKVQPEFAPDVPHIHADRQKLRQVFLNLLTNAGDAMPRGGTLIPRAKPGKTESGQPAVVIEVADTGVGIAPDHLPKVMDPFFTTKEEGKGTGLGLAICRRIIHEHHGTIQIESQLGKGTIIRIVLPASNSTNKSGLQ